jgi:hypothetical protein
MEPNKANPYQGSNQGSQGQQGTQSQQGNQRGQNLTDEDRRRGGQQSAQSQQRSQQGQFAGRPSQGNNQGQASPGRNTEDEKRMEDEGGNQPGNKADQNKSGSGGCGCG